jgi:recombination protein RecR
MRLAAPIEKLADEFAKLPGIGPKTAQRLALYMMKVPKEEALALAGALAEAREKVVPCSQCGYLTDVDPCSICRNQERDSSVLCLVEEAKDVVAVERTGFSGKYFVLNNSRLMDGLDLRNIDFPRLFSLLKERQVQEIIVATNPTIDGEVVARYIAEATKAQNIRVTKLAYGLPVGGDIEYTDEITLKRAFDGRSEF